MSDSNDHIQSYQQLLLSVTQSSVVQIESTAPLNQKGRKELFAQRVVGDLPSTLISTVFLLTVLRRETKACFPREIRFFTFDTLYKY